MAANSADRSYVNDETQSCSVLLVGKKADFRVVRCFSMTTSSGPRSALVSSPVLRGLVPRGPQGSPVVLNTVHLAEQV